MSTNELSQEEFKSTMSGMKDVTDVGDATVDIWNYVAQLVEQRVLPKDVYDKNLVAYVYRNDSKTYDHVLLPIGSPNAFVVMVVDLEHKCVYGHYPLDLNREYGLD